jgi:dTMP kinase
MAYPGFFIVFEGGDGVGKSTQARLLAEWLRSDDGGSRAVVEAREPGGTEAGLAIRGILQHGGHVDPRAEALLYAADRAHNVATVVRPALERGDVVVQDRYVDSSVVYQGLVRGLGDEVARIYRWATGGLTPDLTIVLDTPVDERRLVGAPDRLERDTGTKAEDLRQGFLSLAAAEPGRYVVIGAGGSVDDIAAEIRAAVGAVLDGGGRA